MPPRKPRAAKPAVSMGEALGALGERHESGAWHRKAGAPVEPEPEAEPVGADVPEGALSGYTAQLVQIDDAMADVSRRLAAGVMGKDELAQVKLELATLEKRRMGVVATLKTVHAAELKGLNQARRVRLVVCDWLDRTAGDVSGDV